MKTQSCTWLAVLLLAAAARTVKWINLGEPDRIVPGRPGMHVIGAGKGPAGILAVTVPQF